MQQAGFEPTMWGDPGFLDRWMEREGQTMNAGLVTAKKSLAALLREGSPSCRTRDGDERPIDRARARYLARFSEVDPDSSYLRIELVRVLAGGKSDLLP